MSSSDPTAGGMSREQFARVRELFHRAFGLSPDDRRSLLDHECAGSGDVRDAVQALLDSRELAEGKYNPDSSEIMRRLLNSLAPTELPDQIGPYRVQRLIGQGGMGIVLLAEQSNPQREVALKILRSGPGSENLQGRFGREVRVLGRLEHAGIARIYEAGSTLVSNHLVSYFAMEYVRGLRLTDYAIQLKLDTAARLELVAKIADAVQHAHTKGVIHRDLKPGNILVAEERCPTGLASGSTPGTRPGAAAQPKILDFGVARLLEPDSQQTALTEAGLLIGTVAYMSPEQLGGDNDAIDARADVYAMGVILYELLTGKLPHDIRGKPIAEAARIVRDEDPPPLGAGRSGVAGSSDRDLEAIVAHAMEKDRDRRYQTASALADDIRRYLRHEPILARPATVVYQLTKFARRHRGFVLGTTAATLALVTGLAVSTVLYAREQRARTNADSNERLSAAVQDYMIEDLLMAAAPGRMGFDATVLDVLTESAKNLHERFAGQPEVEARVRMSLGDVFGSLGEFEASAAQWELAVPLLESTVGPNDSRTIASMVKHGGVLQQLRRSGECIRVSSDALARARASLPVGHPVTVQALAQIGFAHSVLGRGKLALPFLAEGVALAEREPEKHAQALVTLRTAMNRYAERPNNAVRSIETSRKAAEEAEASLGGDSPSAIVARSNLLLAYLKQENVEEAVAIAEALPASAERVFAPNHLTRGHVYRNAASAMLLARRHAEAEQLALKANDVFAATFPELNAEHEICFDLLRQIYAEMPARAEQLRVFSEKTLVARFKLAPATRFYTVSKLLDDVVKRCDTAGSPMSREQWLEVLWQKRDQVVPEGNNRRAPYLVNFARISMKYNCLTHFSEALELAEVATPYAVQPAVLTRTLSNLKNKRFDADAD